jgi:Glycosyl hydrolases family 2/Glycosyl hydrolases family 2, sugar binding domain/Glycosyl hydrolases family 2, TIM barrel domain
MRLPRRNFLGVSVCLPAAMAWLAQLRGSIRPRKGYHPQRLESLREPRSEFSLDGNWLFEPAQVLCGVNGANPGLNDRKWSLMTVPGFWRPIEWWVYNSLGGVSESYMGVEQQRVQQFSFDAYQVRAGWYRHWIDIPEALREKKLTLRFTGVASVAKVWWNGASIRSHVGMFGPFDCDITRHVRFGEKNLLSVFVAAGLEETECNMPEMAGHAERRQVLGVEITKLPHGCYDLHREYNNGGIWSPVKLMVTNAVAIEDVYFRPRLDGASIDVTITNRSLHSASLSVRVRLLDRATQEVFFEQKAGKLVEIRPGEQQTVNLQLSHLRPKLWQPDSPNLYILQTLLEGNGQLRDQTDHTVGFRTFEVRGRRFHLNGHPYFLRGAGTPPYGIRPHNAELAAKFMQLMHDGNQVVTRFHTSGASETWMSAADIAGVGVSVEGVWPWLFSGASDIPEEALIRYWRDDQIALFRSLRNHPSILIWTINNEMFFHHVPLPKHHYQDPDRQRRIKKWKLLSDTIKMVRNMDPDRPIVASSEYARGREEFEVDLKPNRIDDGDIDDIHLYNGWYGPSGLLVDVQEDIERVRSQYPRPLISQEASTGYPTNDAGYPVPAYTYNHFVPQAWLGDYVLDSNNPFLRFHARVTQDWMEKIRRHRSAISGWMLFSNCNWFRHAWDPQRIEPYPTYYSAKFALHPVLVSLESPDRHFVKGGAFETEVYIVNDDADFRDWRGTTLEWSIVDRRGNVLRNGREAMPDAPYYRQVSHTVRFSMPPVLPTTRSDLVLKLLLRSDNAVISENQYEIVVAEKEWFRVGGLRELATSGCQTEMLDYIISLGFRPRPVSSLSEVQGSLLVIGPCFQREFIGEKSELDRYIAAGGKVLFLNPSPAQDDLLPLPVWKISDRFGRRNFHEKAWNSPACWGGEFVFISPGHQLIQGLCPPDDLRWWNSGPTGPTVCDWAFDRPGRVSQKERSISSLVDYTAPHGYLGSPQDIVEFQASCAFELQTNSGRLLASTLCLADDPVARRVIANLILYSLR